MVTITGGASGMGRETALAFAAAGAKVVIGDVNGSAGDELVSQITSAGGIASFLKTDVSIGADVEAFIDLAIAKHGRLDVAANVAGIAPIENGLLECSEALWARIIAVNLTGIYSSMRHQIRHMLRNGGGSIVNVSSIGGLIGSASQPAYVAAKHGVIGLTKSAALQYARAGIRVNAVCPGFIRTPMTEQLFGSDSIDSLAAACTPLGRIGTPGEVAQAILWLSSANSSFVTGEAVRVDGGWLAGLTAPASE